MGGLTILSATDEHVVELAATLRPEDAAEVLAQGLGEPGAAVRSSVEFSDIAWAALFDEKVAAMFGVRKVSESSAQLWFLTGREFLAHARHFIRPARKVTQRLAKEFGSLFLHIDARYSGAVRLASRLGFTLQPALAMGPQGALFHFAELRGS